MKVVEGASSQSLQRLNSLMSTRKKMPILLIVGGLGAIGVALAADFIGIGHRGFGLSQLILASAGIVILAGGIGLDLTLGRRYTTDWYSEVIRDKQSLGKFLIITIQLGLLVLVIRQYRLESQALTHTVMPLTFYAFLIHYFLPLQFRLPFFLLASLAGIFAVLGLSNGVWLIGVGLVLIGLCHLPVSFSARIATILITGAFLAVLRLDWVPAPWPSAIWPILGSMFMFRLIIYLYDLRHDSEPVNISRTLSYFFLLPNVIFPFFPVVDYKTFQRTYYDDEQHRIYQKGVKWIFRGITHLLLYRCIKYYLLISPEDVATISNLVQYLITNYSLYLRISGQFHLIVGILHLFGFNLPETHHRYYLASSFNDFWRRINIYWKDFMMKVFYYPAYFRLRKRGTTTALVLSTLFVFFVTWFLHSYQWFWLRGSFPLLWTDVLFWTILAFLVIANSLYEVKHGRKRSLGWRSWSYGNFITAALRTVGTFSVICIMWSLWTSSSLSDWISLWSVTGMKFVSNPKRLFEIFLAATLLIIAAALISKMSRIGVLGARAPGANPRGPAFFISTAITGVLIILVYLISNPGFYPRFGSKTQAVISDLRMPRLSKRDAALLQRGYYEELVGVNSFNTQLWEIYMKRPENWQTFVDTEAGRLTDDFYGIEIVPSSRTIFRGADYSTNRWGMRDKDYELVPTRDTYRIALLGSSHVNGWGVSDKDTFESLLEERLNQESGKGAYTRYEILNFAVGGYTPIQQPMVLENKAFPFKPDALFFVAHPTDTEYSIVVLQKSVHANIELPYSYLKEMVEQSGINSKVSALEARRRLKPFGNRMISCAYSGMVEFCQQQNIKPVWILLPSKPGETLSKDQIASHVRLAKEAGFIVLNLCDVYSNQDVKSCQVAEWDTHPNAKGHRLIADRLYEILRKRRDLIPLRLSAQSEASAKDILHPAGIYTLRSSAEK